MPNLEKSLNALGEVDVKLEIELVHGGWVGYVWITPESGPIVSVDREHFYAHTGARATREEAIAAIPEVIKHIIKKMGKLK